MKTHTLNTTDNYHRNSLESLGWELTVSLMLEDPQSPCRGVIRKGDSFGNLLYNFLRSAIPMDSLHHILEVGGGYGHIMRDILTRDSHLRATMIDISPSLLSRQREILRGFDVRFLENDFLETDCSVLADIDLTILNEVVGDLPTAVGIPLAALSQDFDPDDALLKEVLRIRDTYGIALHGTESVILNLGAIQAVEKLCTAGIPYIYISEHSCEAEVPPQLSRLVEITSPGHPEQIRLHGHDEYTIRFSDLERVAAFFGYSFERGQYLDFIEPVIEGDVPFILCLDSSKVARYEIIRQFIEDLVKYEYLILSRIEKRAQ